MGASLRNDGDLRATFVKVLAGVVLFFVAAGGAIAAFGTGADRPEGVAERWLVAVGDTTRKGVRDRSREEAEEVGPVALAADLLPRVDTDGKAAFVDLEVGKATEADDGTHQVPSRLHPREGADVGEAEEGTVVLRRVDGEWRITALAPPVVGQRVPSEGGPPAADAPWGLYAGAVALATVLTAGCAYLVKLTE